MNSVQGSEPGPLASDDGGVTLDEPPSEVKQDPFAFLGLPGQTKPAQKLSQGLVEAAVNEVKQLQVFFRNNLKIFQNPSETETILRFKFTVRGKFRQSLVAQSYNLSRGTPTPFYGVF